MASVVEASMLTGAGESSNTAAGLDGGAWFWFANTTDELAAAVRGVLGDTDLGVFEAADWPAAASKLSVSLGLVQSSAQEVS